MKRLGDVTIPVTVTAQKSEVALPARTTALSRHDFDKIEYRINRHFEIAEIRDSGVRWVEERGQSEFQSWVTGTSVKPIGDVPGELIEAIRRPATPQHINAHLTRLAAHKRQTKGAGAFKIILEDLAYDLDGVSEWAIMKACEQFRKDPAPFFPETGEIIAVIGKWNDTAKKFGEPPPPPKLVGPPKDEWKPPTEEQKARVRELLKKTGIGNNEEKVENDDSVPATLAPGMAQDDAPGKKPV